MLELSVIERAAEYFKPAPPTRLNGNGSDINFFSTDLPETDPNESDEQAAARIALKYEAMERYSERIVAGGTPSLIISGPPGMGKSWTFENALKHSKRRKHDGVTPIVSEITKKDPDTGEDLLDENEVPIYEEGDASDYYDKISGTCSGPGLYHSCWNMRNGGLVVLDDCDNVFETIDAVNLLKIATDSSEKRILSWRKKSSWLAEHQIPSSFEFKGHIAFLTNIDFEQEIQRKSKAQEHYKALIDRSCYLCLTLRTARDFMIRIRAIAEGPGGMLQRVHGFTPAQERECLSFIERNKMYFYNLSLRLVGQVADEMASNPNNWQRDIRATKMRTAPPKKG